MSLDLETRVGPASARVWGLIVNFAANALLLYGAVGFVADGSRAPALVVGAVMTAFCIVALSAASRRRTPSPRAPSPPVSDPKAS